MAETQVWLSVAYMLNVFHIGPGVDRMGMPIKTTPAFSSGLMARHLGPSSVLPRTTVMIGRIVPQGLCSPRGGKWRTLFRHQLFHRHNAAFTSMYNELTLVHPMDTLRGR